jgi:hypothetical protein
MAIYHDVEQGSLEWFKLRLGIPTASCFGDIMTPKFAPREGKMLWTCIYSRLAEKISGEQLAGFGSRATEQGQLLEDEAINYWEVVNEQRPIYGGFVTTDDGKAGCSPDALIGDDAGLEIKCPNPETHLKYLDEGVLPDDYVTQVYGSLWVTGRKRWHFQSYHKALPAFHLIIERDEAIMEKIGAALANYQKHFDAAFERISKHI